MTESSVPSLSAFGKTMLVAMQIALFSSERHMLGYICHNYDLHKASSEISAKSSSRKLKNMSRDKFMNHLNRAIPSEELLKEYIFSIYDSIKAVLMILSEYF